MPMDVDAVAGNQAIDKLKEIFSGHPHGEREEFADDIIDFVKKMKKKYKPKKDTDETV